MIDLWLTDETDVCKKSVCPYSTLS